MTYRLTYRPDRALPERVIVARLDDHGQKHGDHAWVGGTRLNGERVLLHVGSIVARKPYRERKAKA